MQNYTIAIRKAAGQTFEPVNGIPRNMTKVQAEELAMQARENTGLDCVAYNVGQSNVSY